METCNLSDLEASANTGADNEWRICTPIIINGTITTIDVDRRDLIHYKCVLYYDPNLVSLFYDFQ